MRRILLFLLLVLSAGCQAQTNERNVITEVCGVKFGSSYEECKAKLKNKFGDYDYDFTDKEYIWFKYKYYAGYLFDDIFFHFQRDGNGSYLNECGMCKDCKTADEAKQVRDDIKSSLEKKYRVVDAIGDYGFKFYMAGYGPMRKSIGIWLEVCKYDKDDKYVKLLKRYPYFVRLRYGPYEYVKEEF